MPGALRSIYGEIKLKDGASGALKSFKRSMDEARNTAFNLNNVLSLVGGAAATAGIYKIGKMFSDAGAEEETQALRIKHLAGTGYPELKKSIESAVESSKGLFGESDFEKSANEALKFGASVSLVSNNLGNLQKLSAITGDDLTTTMQGITTAVNTGSIRFLKSNAILAQHMEGFKALGGGYDEATKKRRELYLTEVFKKEELKLMEQYGEVLETMSGATRRAKTQWEEIKEVMGGFLNKALRPIISTAADIMQWFAGTERGVAVLKTITIALVPVIGILLVAALYAAATAAWAFVAPLLPFIAIGLAVVAVITSIVLIIEDLYTWFTGGESVFGHFVKKLFGDISYLKKSFMDFKNSIIQTFKDVINYISGIPDRIVDFFKSLPGRLKETLIEIKDSFKNLFSSNDKESQEVAKQNSSNIPGRARGGRVSRGSAYIVGEKGPETFIPGESGKIIPNGGGVTIGSIVGSMTFNVSGPAEAAQEVKNAVMDALDELSRTVFRTELGMSNA
ncbi:MAG: hypothetical protein PHX78_12475 [bacterium]|nr:hypothetical protein [bacterium]